MTKTTRSDWLIPSGLIALALVPALAGTGRVIDVVSGTATPDNARFLAAPLPLLLHVPAAIVYSVLGAFQFSPKMRREKRGWHRATGRILLPCALLVAISGLWMTLAYPMPAWDGTAVYVERLVAGTAMLLSVVIGVDALRRRAYTEHGDWMIRAYALGMGAGTQVLTHLPWFILVDMHPGVVPRAIMMGSAWVINAGVAEWIIRRARAPRLAPGYLVAR